MYFYSISLWGMGGHLRCCDSGHQCSREIAPFRHSPNIISSKYSFAETSHGTVAAHTPVQMTSPQSPPMTSKSVNMLTAVVCFSYNRKRRRQSRSPRLKSTELFCGVTTDKVQGVTTEVICEDT